VFDFFFLIGDDCLNQIADRYDADNYIEAQPDSISLPGMAGTGAAHYGKQTEIQ